MTDQEIRAAALIGAATFCAPSESADSIDVVRMAKKFADYIKTGKGGEYPS